MLNESKLPQSRTQTCIASEGTGDLSISVTGQGEVSAITQEIAGSFASPEHSIKLTGARHVFLKAPDLGSDALKELCDQLARALEKKVSIARD